MVVGDIRNIRKEKDMGHKTNQKFHGLPYNRLYIMLEYKLKLYGIQLKKLGYPTIFCNSLVVADNGEITDFKMRCEKSKYTTVKALQSIGYDTIASGDSHNDLGMIQASKAGFLFKSTDAIKAEYPEIPAYETYDELYDAIMKAIKN